MLCTIFSFVCNFESLTCLIFMRSWCWSGGFSVNLYPLMFLYSGDDFRWNLLCFAGEYFYPLLSNFSVHEALNHFMFSFFSFIILLHLRPTDGFVSCPKLIFFIVYDLWSVMILPSSLASSDGILLKLLVRFL